MSTTMMAMKGSRSTIRQIKKVISTLTVDSLTVSPIQVLLRILPWPMDSIPRPYNDEARPTMYQIVKEMIDKMAYAVKFVRVTKRVHEAYFGS
ncbi:uncharacterized protein LOC131301247 isoform X2 [Rhododendron vialii]|uniref:uncharacterized protein LOC131301247 isoform X2 n=1 Tax=Rhododendron vialii TaxID=182163 RepID=UPI00265F4B5A|nr:uncharacterized protein LOC131301247 isoform X2 [Rhododendron vialii]